MSDRKHIEYCIRLGNPYAQTKLEQPETKQYIEPQTTYNSTTTNQNIGSFRDRIKNWNTQY